MILEIEKWCLIVALSVPFIYATIQTWIDTGKGK